MFSYFNKEARKKKQDVANALHQQHMSKVKARLLQDELALEAQVITENKEKLELFKQDPNAIHKSTGLTYLYHVAINEQNVGRVKYAIDNGANVNFVPSDSDLSIISYVSYLDPTEDNLKILKLLLEAGADPDGLMGEQKTPLFCAYDQSNKKEGIEKIKMLLKYGGDITKVSIYQESSPLQRIFYNDNFTIFRTAVEHSRNKMDIFNIFQTAKNTHISDKKRQPFENTFWETACRSENVYKCPINGQSFFHDMVEQQNYRKVSEILSNQPYAESDDEKGEYKNYMGQTALHIAAKNGDIRLISLLLQHGSCANAEDNIHFTVLDVLIENGHGGRHAQKILENAGGEFNELNDYTVQKSRPQSRKALEIKKPR